MTRLHFQPIKGKTLDIIDAILQTEEVASAGDMQRPVRLAVEELVVNIVDYAYPNSDKGYLGIHITRDEGGITSTVAYRSTHCRQTCPTPRCRFHSVRSADWASSSSPR